MGSTVHAYGQAWALTHFLMNRHYNKLMEYYQRLGQRKSEELLKPEENLAIFEEVFGSISSEVAQNAECPVLLVPRQAVFRDYDHILYASNSLSLSREAVLKFREFNRLFHARVHFVHINEEDGEHKPGQRERLFAPLFNNPEPEFAFEIDEVTADTVQEGLMTYLKAHPIQLAVMVTRHRGFWANLFHHSDTRQMVLHPETPLLVLHL